MKRYFLITFFILLSFQFVFATETPSILETDVVIKSATSTDSKNSESKEERESEKEKEINILKFGLDEEISTMLDDFMKEKTYLYLDEVLDLFERSKNVALREKIITYFTQAKDLRLSEYALEILEDPFDTKKSTVSLLFKYASELKIKEAGAFARTLLENDNTDYFDSALSAMAVLGTPDDAVFLAEYLEREDLSTAQQQSVMKALGNIKAVETWDALVEIAKDENKNSFVRMYAVEAIGAMERPETVSVLIKLYETTDPNLRTSIIKGLAHYPNDKEAVQVIIESIRDSHYKVRLESISAIKEMKLADAIPYVLYRAKKDPEASVKYACYTVLGELNSKEGEEYLASILTDKKQGDTSKIKASEVLIKYGDSSSVNKVIELAKSTLTDDKKKPLRYALGKVFANTENSSLAEICLEYLNSKDAATVGTGLDIFAKNKFPSVRAEVQKIADAEKTSANRTKARKILDRE